MAMVKRRIVRAGTRLQVVDCQAYCTPEDFQVSRPSHGGIACHAFPAHKVLCRRPSFPRATGSRFRDVGHLVVIIRIEKILLRNLLVTLFGAARQDGREGMAERASVCAPVRCWPGGRVQGINHGNGIIDGYRCTSLRITVRSCLA